MITFQAIIDEARRQKNILALDFYNMLKEEQVDYDKFDLIAYFENEGSETAVCFGVDTWVENASYCENNIKLATINVEDFDEDHELSFKNVLTSLDEQLDDFEKALHKKMRVKVRSGSINFEYKGFWVESESFDQAENGHPEDGITFTSYVWHSREEMKELKDDIEILRESFDSPEELEMKMKKKIDKYIKKQKKGEKINDYIRNSYQRSPQAKEINCRCILQPTQRRPRRRAIQILQRHCFVRRRTSLSY